MSFGTIPLSPDDKPDGFVLLSMYKKLESENAKLREQSERLFDKTLELATENAKLREENAKLRKLVRDAWDGGHSDKSCGDCEIRDECHDDIERLSRDGALRFSRCLFELRIEDRMRELGIEVD